jgi:hypothetical protein
VKNQYFMKNSCEMHFVEGGVVKKNRRKGEPVQHERV